MDDVEDEGDDGEDEDDEGDLYLQSLRPLPLRPAGPNRNLAAR